MLQFPYLLKNKTKPDTLLGTTKIIKWTERAFYKSNRALITTEKLLVKYTRVLVETVLLQHGIRKKLFLICKLYT